MHRQGRYQANKKKNIQVAPMMVWACLFVPQDGEMRPCTSSACDVTLKNIFHSVYMPMQDALPEITDVFKSEIMVVRNILARLQFYDCVP